MIESIRFHNFKALRKAKVELSPFSLIVGPNASGKTSVLKALHYIAQLAARSPEDIFVGEAHPSRLQSCSAMAPGPCTFSLSVRIISGQKRMSLHARIIERGVDDWDFYLRNSRATTKPPLRLDFRDPAMEQRLMSYLGSTVRIPLSVLLQLDAAQLAEPGFSGEAVPRVNSDGSNLAAVLADMRVSDPRRLDRIAARLRKIVPAVQDIRFKRTPIESSTYEPVEQTGLFREVRNRSTGYRMLLDWTSAPDLGAELASEGTLLTLGLLTILEAETCPQLVLIDELERGLHPRALGTLVSQIREVMTHNPNLQVVGTTHSPYLADHFQPDEIILTTLDDDGYAVVGKLNEHPDFEKWKDEMKPGEFWSSVGEDWLKDKKGKKSD